MKPLAFPQPNAVPDDPLRELQADWRRLSEVPEILPNLFPTRGSWEWFYRNRDTNGVGHIFRQIGNRKFVNIRLLRDYFEGPQSK